MTVNGFRDLRVWQVGMDLVEEVYRVTRGFPRHEVYGLAGQMQRAAVSIPSNIAEGQTRSHIREYLHHLSIAQGSLAELQTQLEIAARLTYASQPQIQPILNQATSLAKQLHALRQSLAKHDESPRANLQYPKPTALNSIPSPRTTAPRATPAP
ncbi:MAG: four helix bundle protein [Chloroflexi bacterium]|nr:four helix bundle protein [Chloroflexota bacterium]